MAAAISGSAWSSGAVKNESGAEAVLAKVILRISPPPQPFGRLRAGLVWRSEAASAIYHIARPRPSGCGSGLIFMQDMVGIEGFRHWGGPMEPLCLRTSGMGPL